MKNLAMSHNISVLLSFATLLAISLPLSGVAEENLLWKATSVTPARVVPSYSGSGSPFPVTAAPKAVSESIQLDEQARARDAAYATARSIFENGSDLRIDTSSITIGGTVEGLLGPRVLINNQWLGLGGKLQVRQYRTQQIQDALKTLAELDPDSARELNSSINAKLAAKPTLDLVVSQITSQTLTLKGPFSAVTLKINTDFQ